MKTEDRHPKGVVSAAFAVHLVHVLAMAIIVGGTTAGVLGSGSRRLEIWLWAAMGAIVVTGVGNVGRYGQALPGPAALWGTVLLAKLVLVLVLLVVSLRRSLVVWAGGDARPWYQASAGLAAGVAAAGVWLAHG